jgi:phage tail tube protein FII
MVAGFAPVAQAIEPVKISRDDTALDLTATTEIYKQRGEAFQVSTAAGADGIVRRIEVRSSSHGAFRRLGGVCARQCHRRAD